MPDLLGTVLATVPAQHPKCTGSIATPKSVLLWAINNIATLLTRPWPLYQFSKCSPRAGNWQFTLFHRRGA